MPPHGQYTLAYPQQHQGLLSPAPAHYGSQATSLPNAFSTITLQDPTWHIDTDASSYLNFNASNLGTIFDKRLYPSVHVGNGNSIPVTNSSHSIIPSIHRPLHLNNVFVTPNIIKNLIYVRQYTKYNNCTIEFDAFGFSVKDLLTRHILLRYDSSGDLYPVTKPSTIPVVFLSTSSSTWHQHLCHPGDEVLCSLVSCKSPSPLLPSQIHPLDHPSPPLLNEQTQTHTVFTRSQLGIVKPIDRLSLNTFSISLILKWCNAMYDEYNALVKNGTWLLVPRPTSVNMVRSMWLFKHKFHADGTLNRYKARLVANGSSQQLGVDFDETFSPVVKLATIRTVLSLVVSRQWPIHQLDVKDAFLNDDLSETVYMHQPPGFVDSRGLQVMSHGLDYMIVTAILLSLFLDRIIDSLHNEFDVTDLGALNYFLGISVDRNSTESKLDLSYVVHQVCLYMHDPREPHFASLKHILGYVQGTVDFGLQLYVSATTSLVGYTDADWAGCPSTRRLTLGYCVFLGDNLLSWSAKHQHTLSRSSVEAEYRGVANVVAETAWLHNLLCELNSLLSTATLVYCDNVSAVYMFSNPVQHQRTKDIEIDIHFVCVMVTAGQVSVLHVPSRYQYSDIFTKGLPSALFEDFQSSLSVRPPLAQTAGAY
ncbi:ribonuclease H-like domain-containing protein [Tanacetum coccineum]